MWFPTLSSGWCSVASCSPGYTYASTRRRSKVLVGICQRGLPLPPSSLKPSSKRTLKCLVSICALFRPPLATMGGFLFHLLVSVKICPKTVRTYDVSASSTIKLTLPGTDPVDAQRRK